jgi:hypothetical protein
MVGSDSSGFSAMPTTKRADCSSSHGCRRGDLVDGGRLDALLGEQRRRRVDQGQARAIAARPTYQPGDGWSSRILRGRLTHVLLHH